MPAPWVPLPLVLAVLALLAVLVSSCARREEPAPHAGPIVLITLDSLRADVVSGLGGPRGLTPHLERLVREADWSGRAVASSSWGVPAMASLLTGLRPWQHQAILARQATLSPDLVTLPEALQALGYDTAGYPSGYWYTDRHGYAQGFAAFEDFARGRAAADRLSSLTAGRRFVWIHIPEPQSPYVRRDWLLSRLGPAARAGLPRRVQTAQLEPFFDPGVTLPPELRQRFWSMYLLNTAWADERLGRLLGALRASGQWDRTLLVVTANHGEEFGEKGQILQGGNLGRQLLEVPLLVKLPAGSGYRIAAPESAPVAAARIWATLVEAAGGPVPPAVAPSLFRPVSSTGAPAGILSELYLTNGTNRFSLVEGQYQLLLDSRFAPAEADYYAARRGETAAPEALFERLYAAFESTPPLTGRPGLPPRRPTLERWQGGGGAGTGTTRVQDLARQAAMAQRLRALWGEMLPEENPPAEEARHWGHGGDGWPLPVTSPAGSAAGSPAGSAAKAAPEDGGGGRRPNRPRASRESRRRPERSAAGLGG